MTMQGRCDLCYPGVPARAPLALPIPKFLGGGAVLQGGSLRGSPSVTITEVLCLGSAPGTWERAGGQQDVAGVTAFSLSACLTLLPGAAISTWLV